MRKFFLSFADSRMAGALARIRTQAEDMQCYDHIVVADQSYLNIDFREKYKDKLTVKVRGYGYWCWKPQVILQLLDQVEDGDIIQYTDAGCHLNVLGRARLMEYFDMVNQSESGILAFAAAPPSFHDASVSLPDMPEYKWCKDDLFEFLGVSGNHAITHASTIGATVIFVKKNKKSQEMIERWLNTISNNFSLLDDAPSVRPNINGFIEHRHDQSIFSVLCKLNHVALASAYEYWYPFRYIHYPNWSKLRNFPIHAKRDKGLSFTIRVIDLAKKILKRLTKN